MLRGGLVFWRLDDRLCARLPRPVFFTDRGVTFFQFVQLLIRELLNIDHVIAGGHVGADELVQLEMKRLGVPVLRVLNQEHDQKRDDGGSGIDDELPGIRKMEERPADGPCHQHHDREQEHVRMSDKLSGPAGKAAEPEAHAVGLDDLLTGLVQGRLCALLWAGNVAAGFSSSVFAAGPWRSIARSF